MATPGEYEYKIWISQPNCM